MAEQADATVSKTVYLGSVSSSLTLGTSLSTCRCDGKADVAVMDMYDIDLDSDVKVYKCKDGRYRAYIKSQKRVVSYPRLLMAVHLKRNIRRDEHVHHIDGNTDNNNINNLVVLNKEEHEKLHANLANKDNLFSDRYMVCPVCGKTFLWTIRQQRNRIGNANRKNSKNTMYFGPFCSKSCAGKLGAEIANKNRCI